MYILDTQGKSIDLKLENRPMVLLCPGGGYAFTSFREAEPLAMSFLSKGYHACVLDYSVAPARFPTQLLEVEEAMKMLTTAKPTWMRNGTFPRNQAICGILITGGMRNQELAALTVADLDFDYAVC